MQAIHTFTLSGVDGACRLHTGVDGVPGGWILSAGGVNLCDGDCGPDFINVVHSILHGDVSRLHPSIVCYQCDFVEGGAVYA